MVVSDSQQRNWFQWLPVPLTMIVVAVMGVLSNCSNQRFNGLSEQLKVIDQRTFEMNTRLSRIEGKLDVTANVPPDNPLPSNLKQ